MERHQLKRIMIIILATLNAFLCLYLIRQRVSERAAAFRAEKNLLELFAADGIAISPETIPRGTPPPVIQLSSDSAELAQAAAFFFGEDAEIITQSNARRFETEEGVVRFHSDGSFTATGLYNRTDPDTFCREFCRNWSYAPPDSDSIHGGDITLTARYGNLSVYNCGVCFLFDGDVLTEAYGTLIPRTGHPAETPKLTAMDALVIFQAKRRENRVVSAEIRRVSLCYALQSAEDETLTLVPMWRVETDTVPYYVNCVTGGLVFS